jgi:small nuclear ribonucleoprotein (snRNP)-like protein
MQENMDKDELKEYLNKPVVVDTGTPFIYIGTLSQIGNSFITLKDVDVRHVDGGGASKEKYILSARKFGIKKNRFSTKIRIDVMTSISHLEDVVEY